MISISTEIVCVSDVPGRFETCTQLISASVCDDTEKIKGKPEE